MEHHLVETKFHLLLHCQSYMKAHALLRIPVSACRDSVSITTPFAGPHINVRRIWHILVKFTWRYVSPDATVVPVNMTFHMKG
jgi:hypothetical protein